MATEKLWLNSAENVRRSIARVVRKFNADPNADVARFRALVYGIKGVIEALRFEKELELEQRIEALEELIAEKNKDEKSEVEIREDGNAV